MVDQSKERWHSQKSAAVRKPVVFAKALQFIQQVVSVRFQVKLLAHRQLVAEAVPFPLGTKLQFRTHFAVRLLN